MIKSAWIKAAFIIPVLWWAYLFFTTQFIVVYDAIGYEQLGHTIAYQGWAQFLTQGPEREPLFPAIVALSMRLGDVIHLPYDYPLKFIGLLFLFFTMFLSWRLMKMLSVRPSIAAALVLYMGLSPVMTNSSLRLWSEFAAYPWVVLAVIWTIKSWDLLQLPLTSRKSVGQLVGYGAMVALMFLLIMSVKAVAEGVLLFYLLPFYWQVVAQWRLGNLVKARQAFIFCLTVLIIFEAGACGWRLCNYHYNGHFAFTDRGDWAFYGNTARRMQPLTPTRLGAAVAYVPGMGICTAHFLQDDCRYWSADQSDDIIAHKFTEVKKQGIKPSAGYYIAQGLQMIMANPLQALGLMVIEAHKMFFWEASLGFVVYPDWVDASINSAAVLYTLRVIMALLSWAACVFTFFQLRQPVGWVINFVFWYMAAYSLFFVLDRYSFPIVPLFLVLIAVLVDRLVDVTDYYG